MKKRICCMCKKRPGVKKYDGRGKWTCEACDMKIMNQMLGKIFTVAQDVFKE